MFIGDAVDHTRAYVIFRPTAILGGSELYPVHPFIHISRLEHSNRVNVDRV
jgi:hypothetical protein